ncbi:MAG TPA: NTP transferase domain-containing protein [Bacteroidota bacterium]|nr:NTP transferase domain-containing protein [Bacteroidota bacterium]
MNSNLAVVIMAAGKGTRMNNPDMAKVMYPINGKPLVEHVVDLALQLKSSRTVVIVGWKRESVIDYLRTTGKPAVCVEQVPQLGTGHAVMQAEKSLADFTGDVLVLSGDVPLLSFATTRSLIEHHRKEGAIATVLTAVLPDATGYGRMIRNPHGDVTGIVEHKDATEEQRQIREINSGIYVFDKLRLFEGLQHITPSNLQQEYYLTDVFEYFWKNDLKVCAIATPDSREIQGINTPQQLEDAREAMAAGRVDNQD